MATVTDDTKKVNVTVTFPGLCNLLTSAVRLGKNMTLYNVRAR